VNHKRFLIIRQDRIGDVVLSTSLPREIKRVYPDSYVTMLVTGYTKDILLNNPHIDEIIIIPPKEVKMTWKECFSFVKKLRNRRFDFAFMLLPDERINYLIFLAGIKMRIGVGYKFYQFITFAGSVNRNKYIPLRHEADYCLDMLRKIGINPVSNTPEIYLSEEEKKNVEEIRKRLSPEGNKIIGINSTSGNSAPNMPPAEYRKLINILSEKTNCIIAITDYDPPEELKGIKDVNYICKGKSLRESIINIAAVDILVSASTGPMHIASALKIAAVALFCPLTACSPKLWGPLGNKNSVILPRQDYCSKKCPGDPKKCTFEGEGGIDAVQVYEKIISFIQ
jgi:ADP-heptose:LPS heptosyltransferase